MPSTWSPHRPVRSLDDLPPALGLGSLHEVGEWISDRVQDAGKLWFDWGNATDDFVSAGNSAIGMVPIRLDLPATLGSLRKSVAGFAGRVRTRIAIAQLADDAKGNSGDEVRITDLLAGFLQTDRFTLLATIGGGWHPVDGSSLTGDNATPMTWLGAGHPLQILLGLSDQTVSLARPVETRGGLAGPGVLEAAEPVDIDLGTADTLTTSQQRRLGFSPSLGATGGGALDVARTCRSAASGTESSALRASITTAASSSTDAESGETHALELVCLTAHLERSPDARPVVQQVRAHQGGRRRGRTVWSRRLCRRHRVTRPITATGRRSRH